MSPAQIMIVDDDPTTRVLLGAALRREGYEVTPCESGDEALRVFAPDLHQMVMLDVDMPGLSGYETCRAMRQVAGELLPIVMVTGMDDVESVRQAYDSGATDFIQKPINWALIGHRVRYLMRGYEAMRGLRDAKASEAAVLAAIPDLLFEMDSDGRYVRCHTPRPDMLVMPLGELIGRTVEEVMPPEAAAVCRAAFREAQEKGLSTGKQYEIRVPRGLLCFELSVSCKQGESGAPNFIVVCRDITERKEAERRIMRLAFFDSLTGLPNRQSFLERVEREVRRAEQRDARFAVLFLDLDGFKAVNDTMGHSAGDAVLRQAAERLQRGIRDSDVLSHVGGGSRGDFELARLGGDEFTALIMDIGGPDDALAVAQRALDLMRQPFDIDGREVRLASSIGIALYPEDGRDAGTLLKHSDTAMYHAKESGRANFQFYNASMTAAAISRMELERDLRLALERDEFTLVYQPQYDVMADAVHSVEALIRWKHPQRGVIEPSGFLALAEESGQVLEIGTWALRRACADAARWNRGSVRLRVAVNLSPRQLRDIALMDVVRSSLSESGLAPEMLELEVAEGALLQDTDRLLDTMRSLREAGVNIALDDFGTSYSSLSYLKRMPLETLKIDRSFIHGLPHDEENRIIVRAILSMASSLGVGVTAEGVETMAQATTLRDMSCDRLQGHLFSRPVPAEQVPALAALRWPQAEPISLTD